MIKQKAPGPNMFVFSCERGAKVLLSTYRVCELSILFHELGGLGYEISDLFHGVRRVRALYDALHMHVLVSLLLELACCCDCPHPAEHSAFYLIASTLAIAAGTIRTP